EEEEDDVSVEDNHGGIHSDQEINNCNNVSDVEEVPETCFNVPEGLQETKMESIDLLSVSSCWGNLMFDYVHSDSVGNSGGILSMWDPNSFCKSSFTRSDYFVIIRGLWL
nr:RNA-directed DNA polymerase, eukaryota, reverse transcriptase zinc-binding domain protein [Tanacetum cinerariifolium]